MADPGESWAKHLRRMIKWVSLCSRTGGGDAMVDTRISCSQLLLPCQYSYSPEPRLIYPCFYPLFHSRMNMRTLGITFTSLWYNFRCLSVPLNILVTPMEGVSCIYILFHHIFYLLQHFRVKLYTLGIHIWTFLFNFSHLSVPWTLLAILYVYSLTFIGIASEFELLITLLYNWEAFMKHKMYNNSTK